MVGLTPPRPAYASQHDESIDLEDPGAEGEELEVRPSQPASFKGDRGLHVRAASGVASPGPQTQEGSIAYFTHIGGFLAGALLAVAIRLVRGQWLGDPTRGLWIGPFFRKQVVVAMVILMALLALLV